MLLGKTKEFWCSRLNFSCSGDELRSLHIDTDVAGMVWFENPQRKLEINRLRGNRIQAEYFGCAENFEFVWFEDGNTQPGENKILPKETWETGLKQVKEVLESNSNLVI